MSSLVHLSRQAPAKLAAALERAQTSARLAEPLQVFYLGIQPMVRTGEPAAALTAGLAAAKAIAWRFFVLSGNRAVAATEIAMSSEGGAPYWSHISYDPRNQSRLSLIRRVQEDPRYGAVTYELRYLRIPALDLSALLWLKPAEGGEDVVIPMGYHALLRSGWPYSYPKLFDALEDHARRRLASSTLPRNASET